MSGARYLGMRGGDLAGKAYAHYWTPVMVPLSRDAREALAVGPVAWPLALSLADAAHLVDADDHALENGFALGPGGELHVAVRTAMPGVRPAMIDWWFGWHSDEPQRYKLWHPRAHVHAAWDDGGADAHADARPSDRARYLGRTSLVDEYVGSALGRYAIRFVHPRDLGLDAEVLSDPARGTAICARIGFAEVPIEFGTLVHLVRPSGDGACMRSRFWIGGPHARARPGVGALRGGVAAIAARAAKRVKRPTAEDGRALLVHCAEEMAHLASFLPSLYTDLSGRR